MLHVLPFCALNCKDDTLDKIRLENEIDVKSKKPPFSVCYDNKH